MPDICYELPEAHSHDAAIMCSKFFLPHRLVQQQKIHRILRWNVGHNSRL